MKLACLQVSFIHLLDLKHMPHKGAFGGLKRGDVLSGGIWQWLTSSVKGERSWFLYALGFIHDGPQLQRITLHLHIEQPHGVNDV